MLGWNLLGILPKGRILNVLGVFSRVKMRMGLFDSFNLFSKNGPLCRKFCSFLMNPHTSILDSHFFLEVKVSAQGHEFLCPGSRVSARTR